MSTSIRYKFIKNKTGDVILNVPVTTDGDDKKSIIVRRVLTEADIGTAEGQTRSNIGLSIEGLSATTNVLFIKGSAHRRVISGGVTWYETLDNLYSTSTDLCLIKYGLGPDNSLRILDSGLNLGQLVEDDVIILEVFIGNPIDPDDKMVA